MRPGVGLQQPVLAIGVAVSAFDGDAALMGDRIHHGGGDRRDIVGMHGRPPVEVGEPLLLDVPEGAQHAVQVNAPALGIAGPDHHRRLLGHQPEALLRDAQLVFGDLPRLLGPGPLEAEPDLTCDRNGELDLVGREDVAAAVIGHEFADHAALGDQRDEGETADAFLENGCLDPLGLVRGGDVLHQDRLRVAVTGLPRRMAFEPLTVVVRQPAPGDKAHDAGLIEEQHRGTAFAKRADNRVERGIVNVVDRPGAVELVGQPIEGGKLVSTLRKPLRTSGNRGFLIHFACASCARHAL